MELNPRQQAILRATVRHYVNTAEPVGSKSLATGYGLSVSSATIRNVMSALEASGLLYQPHTSAGRIPSASGYRRYVDDLMPAAPRLTRQVELALNDALDWKHQALAVLLQESAQILSRLSGYIALVTMPQREASIIKHLQLVRVGEDQILLIVIDIYDNHSVLLRLPCEVLSEQSETAIEHELQILSNFLTDQLQGRSLHSATLDWSDLDQDFQRYANTLQQALANITRKSRIQATPQILISGVAEAIDQPEFSEREQLRTIVQLLEDGRDQLWPLIAEPSPIEMETTPSGLLSAPSLRIWIGEENPVEPMQSCALIAATYGDPPGPTGSLGVLGPTRMLYENAIASVEAAASYLTNAVSEAF